jgi:hypothetical protein
MQAEIKWLLLTAEDDTEQVWASFLCMAKAPEVP